MPHQCVACGKLIEGASEEILKGCNSCGGKLFFFIKKTRLEQLQKEKNKLLDLSDKDKKQIEEDVYDILGDDADLEKPIVLDFESIRIDKPGSYELDLVKLFQEQEPLIYKLEEGKYVIDIVESFNKLRKKK